MTEPKTVTARIALAVGPDGKWNAIGCNDGDDDDVMGIAMEDFSMCASYWVSVTVPVPEAQEIDGKVEDAADA